jgi:glycosyltransferase involved in cell wall biosynthesis
MAHVVINGISAKSGGGKSILTNFLSVLEAQKSAHRFTVLVPDAALYNEFRSENISVRELPVMSKQLLIALASSWYIPVLIQRLGCDLIFNLADIPVRTTKPQIFLFDWSYAAYPESIAWHRSSRMDTLRRRFKYYFFNRYLRYVDVLIAQGPAIGKRLCDLYGINRIPVIPNAVSLDNLNSPGYMDFRLGDGYKLLCLSQYYSHKNLEILVELAEHIRQTNKNWKIILTIHPNQGAGARALLQDIARRNLSENIVNIGPVEMKDVPSLYRQCDALVLPTLLESFSGTYVEAMFHQKPIFTSNYEFAMDVCKDAAWYFDPLDVSDIVKCIQSAVDNPHIVKTKLETGKNLLDSMSTWEQATTSFLDQIDNLLKEAQ